MAGSLRGGDIEVSFEDRMNSGQECPCSLLESILEDAVDGADAVSPADLFAFFVGAAVVGDGNLINGDFEFGDLGGDFGFEAEAVFLDGDFLQYLAAEHFVTGLHVGEVQVGEHVGHEGEKLVPHGVPEVEHAVHTGAEESRAEDNIRATREDRHEEFGVLIGVVFEIGVLDDDDVGIDVLESGAQGGSFALVDLVGENADAVVGLGEGLHGLPSAVFGTIIDHHQFRDFGAGEDFFDDDMERLFLVVNGDDDTEAAGWDFDGVHGFL